VTDNPASDNAPSNEGPPDDTEPHSAASDSPVPDSAALDGLDLAPPPPPETVGSKWAPLGVAAVVAGLLAVAVIVWQPWDRYGSTCWETDAHLIDEDARLCYLVPEGWDRMSGGELKESAADSGFEVPSSGILSLQDKVYAQVKVQTLDAYLGGGELDGEYEPDEELRIMAELVTVSSQAMFEGHDSIDSESLTIDGFGAATATADAPDPFGGFGEGAESIMWVRATIVDFGGDKQSVVYSMALLTEADSDEVIAQLNEVHESIEVLDP
jgi:hypothetical protein